MPHNLRMLCVDDHPDLRRSLEQQFVNEDFIVDTAEDGIAALEKIKTHQYDIVLLDMMMPRLDGMGVLKEMKRINRLTNVIMLTAVDDVPTAMECVKLGAKDFIQKPYDPEELLHVVIKVLGI
ncbi:MAG TPA: response regulator [Bacteroidota bacterium]|nr:response regulator [Bacteroidota bacterium]